MSHLKFPGLLVELALWLEKSGQPCLLDFLASSMVHRDTASKIWLSSHLNSKKSSESPSTLAQINSFLLSSLDSILPDNSSPISDENLIRALSLLRVIAILKSFVNYTIPDKLFQRLMDLLLRPVSTTWMSSQFTSYALAFLIAIRPSLKSSSNDLASTGHHQSASNGAVITWLQRLMQQQNSNGDHSANAAMLAVLFHTNQSGLIADLLASLLGLRLPALGRCLGSWRQLLLQDVFTESMITSQVARLPVVGQLNSFSPNQLPLHCVLQLFRSQAFAKHRFNMKDWIFNQIIQSSSPLHPLLPDLLDAQITHAFSAWSSGILSETDLVSHLIPASLIADQFDERLGSRNSASYQLTPALLLLFYTLTVVDLQLARARDAKKRGLPTLTSVVYSQELLTALPVVYLLQLSHSRLSDYATLYPRLMQLVVTHLPYLTLGEMTIQDELLLVPTWRPTINQHRLDTPSSRDSSVTQSTSHLLLPSIASVERAFQSLLEQSSTSPATTSSSHLVRLLLRLTRCSTNRRNGIDQLLPYAPILAIYIPKLLLLTDDLFQGNLHFAHLIERLWRQLHLFMPAKLELEAASAMLIRPSPRHQITLTGMYEDPVENLLSLADARVFRSPHALRIFIRLIESCLVASKHQLTRRLIDRRRPPQQSDDDSASDQDLERQCTDLLLMQQAVVVQLLLEHCLVREGEENHEISVLREVRGIICAYIHHMFIAQRDLVEIVLTQTFPKELIPITVQAIPSLHICLDTIVAMFQNSDNFDKLVFYFDLISHLSLHYNIPNVLDRSAYMLDALYHFLTVLDGEVTDNSTYNQALTCLKQTIDAFECLARRCSAQRQLYHAPEL